MKHRTRHPHSQHDGRHHTGGHHRTARHREHHLHAHSEHHLGSPPSAAPPRSTPDRESKVHNRHGHVVRSPDGVHSGGPGQLRSRPNMDSPTPDLMVDEGQELFGHTRQHPGV
jgi:hypothetical protein